MYTAIFVTLFLLLWAACGTAVWLTASVATRGEAGILTLPLAVFAAAVGGLAVPLLIRDDETGLWLSVAAALLLAALVVGARAFARNALAARDPLAAGNAGRGEEPGAGDSEVGL